MSGSILIKELDLIMESAAQSAERLGAPGAKTLATQIRILAAGADALSEEVKAAAKDEPAWVTMVAIGIGVVAAAALTPDLAPLLVGALASRGLVTASANLNLLAEAVTSWIISDTYEEWVRDEAKVAPDVARMATTISANIPSVLSGAVVPPGPNIPQNVLTWGSGAATDNIYTIFNSDLTSTDGLIDVAGSIHDNNVKQFVQGPSGIYLTIDKPGSTKPSITINGGIIDPFTESDPYVMVGKDGSTNVGLAMLKNGQELITSYTQDGSILLTIGSPGSSSGDKVVTLIYSGFYRSSVSISSSSSTTIIDARIGAGGSVEVDQDYADASAMDTYTFASDSGTLRLDHPGSFLGRIYGLTRGNTIDLAGIDSAVDAVLGSGNDLILKDADGASVTLHLDPSQSFAGLTFSTALDGHGGTDVFLSAPPMVAGTQTVTIEGTVVDQTGNPYSVNVSFAPSSIQFPAFRTDDPLPDPVRFAATIKGGNLDPQAGANIVISQLNPNPSALALLSGFEVGPPSTSATSEIALQTSPAGDYTGQMLPLNVSYEGGATELDLTVSTKIYAPAVPAFEAGGAQTFALDFGTIHLGETASRSVDIANVATGNLVDDLSSSPGTLGQFTAENGFSHIPAGDSAAVVVDMTGEVPGAALALGGAPLFGLTGHDSDLPDEAVGQQSFLVLRGTVNYYANPIFSNNAIGSPVGTLTQSGNGWTLDLGTVGLGSYGSDANVEIVNATPSASYSDTLTGTAEVSTPSDGGFIQAINDLAGQMAFGKDGFLALGVFQPYGDLLGKHSETITFHPVSSNDSGFSGALPDETITIIDEVVQAPCYAAGTHIATPDGDMPVEELAVGDTVVAQFAGHATIRWIGRRNVHCSRHPEPERVWPVRVQAGAFHDGVPYRDLWLSPDHAVFVDGVLIPIRLLINGTTIVQQAVEQMTYFHVELPQHDVLLAEGLPAESYLDTGNRAMFAGAGLAMMLHPDFATVNAGLKCWEHDACAPLATSAAQMEPIWERLAGRARTLGRPVLKPSTTTDSRLRLEVRGHQLRPHAGRDGWHIFVLPPGTDAVRLISNAGAPSDVHPWLEDRRRLGVSVRRVRAHLGTELVDIPVDGPALKTGWHGVERHGEQLWRWTDGSARLQVPTGTITLEIQLAGSAEYRAEASVDEFIGPPCPLVTLEFHSRTA